MIEVLGGKMDLHMGSHSLPLKFMPCMHSHCLRLFSPVERDPYVSCFPFGFCLHAIGVSMEALADSPFPSHFDQAINAIVVLGLLLYVGRICRLGYALSGLNYK